MRQISAILLAAVVLSASAAAAWGRDIYVNNRIGRDEAYGSSPEIHGQFAAPLRTINRALQVCRRGDRIILAQTEEPYRETLSLSAGRHWGTTRYPLVIEGNGAILDGSAPVPPTEWEAAGKTLFRFRPRYLAHQQLLLDGKPAVRKMPDPARPGEIDLEPLEWMLTEGYIYFRPEKDRLPRSYNLEYAKRLTGITLYHVRHVRIEDLVVQGFALDGINAHDGCVAWRLRDVTTRGNGRSGMSIGGASRLVATECLSGDNGLTQVRTEGYCDARFRDCDLLQNTGPAYEIHGGRLYIDGALRVPGDESAPQPEPGEL